MERGLSLEISLITDLEIVLGGGPAEIRNDKLVTTNRQLVSADTIGRYGMNLGESVTGQELLVDVPFPDLPRNKFHLITRAGRSFVRISENYAGAGFVNNQHGGDNFELEAEIHFQWGNPKAYFQGEDVEFSTTPGGSIDLALQTQLGLYSRFFMGGSPIPPIGYRPLLLPRSPESISEVLDQIPLEEENERILAGLGFDAEEREKISAEAIASQDLVSSNVYTIGLANPGSLMAS